MDKTTGWSNVTIISASDKLKRRVSSWKPDGVYERGTGSFISSVEIYDLHIFGFSVRYSFKVTPALLLTLVAKRLSIRDLDSSPNHLRTLGRIQSYLSASGFRSSGLFDLARFRAMQKFVRSGEKEEQSRLVIHLGDGSDSEEDDKLETRGDAGEENAVKEAQQEKPSENTETSEKDVHGDGLCGSKPGGTTLVSEAGKDPFEEKTGDTTSVNRIKGEDGKSYNLMWATRNLKKISGARSVTTKVVESLLNGEDKHLASTIELEATFEELLKHVDEHVNVTLINEMMVNSSNREGKLKVYNLMKEKGVDLIPVDLDYQYISAKGLVRFFTDFVVGSNLIIQGLMTSPREVASVLEMSELRPYIRELARLDFLSAGKLIEICEEDSDLLSMLNSNEFKALRFKEKEQNHLEYVLFECAKAKKLLEDGVCKRLWGQERLGAILSWITTRAKSEEYNLKVPYIGKKLAYPYPIIKGPLCSGIDLGLVFGKEYLMKGFESNVKLAIDYKMQEEKKKDMAAKIARATETEVTYEDLSDVSDEDVPLAKEVLQRRAKKRRRVVIQPPNY